MMNEDSDWKSYIGGVLLIFIGCIVLGFSVGWAFAAAVFMICIGLILVISDYIRFVAIRAINFTNRENNSNS